MELFSVILRFEHDTFFFSSGKENIKNEKMNIKRHTLGEKKKRSQWFGYNL